MTYRKATFECKNCKREIQHLLPVKGFELAKDAIKKKGCTFCRHISLKYLGRVQIRLGCGKCGKSKNHKVAGGNTFKSRVKGMLRIGCPECKSKKSGVTLIAK